MLDVVLNVFLICYAAQVNDEHVLSGGVAMETADLKAVQPGPH